MPATNSGTTPELVYALKRGEDSALEHVFHTHYDELRQQAREALDEAGSARVLERVFIAVWKERVRFETPGEIGTFLSTVLREEIMREQRRLAAVHRFEETEQVHLENGRLQRIPSADELWVRISSSIHAPPPDAKRTAHLLADQSRHLAAVHVEAIGARSNWKRASLSTLLTIAMTGALIGMLDRASAPVKVEKAFASPDVRTLTTRLGQRGTIELRDGGTAVLGPRSTLQIPPGFGDGLRVVRVEGAVQLRAAAGASQPIEARLTVAPITVSGTSFSVSAYPEDGEYFVAANASDAQISVGSTSIAVARGEVLAIEPGGTWRAASKAEVDEVLGWTREQFVVNDRPLRDALTAMRMAYGLEIVVPDAGLLDRLVKVRAPLSSSKDAIAALETTGGLRFGYDEEQMVLRDANPPPNAIRR